MSGRFSLRKLRNRGYRPLPVGLQVLSNTGLHDISWHFVRNGRLLVKIIAVPAGLRLFGREASYLRLWPKVTLRTEAAAQVGRAISYRVSVHVYISKVLHLNNAFIRYIHISIYRFSCPSACILDLGELQVRLKGSPAQGGITLLLLLSCLKPRFIGHPVWTL